MAIDAVVSSSFPALQQEVGGKPLVYLDSAATTQKPQCVIDAVRFCYEHEYANIHRGVYWLSQQATKAYEETRVKVQRFLNAASADEIKKAYRKLMSENHPDKLAGRGLPESMREMAEERTREISHAYDVIKDARN